MGGGGGAGGYIEFTSLPLTGGVLSITVGDGGAGAPGTSVGPAGTAGNNSILSGPGITLTSIGGAGGASYSQGGYPATSNGGSGGGASGAYTYSSINSTGTQTSQTQTPSLASIGGSQYGFDGSVAGNTWYPGGGGGAGANGSNTPATGGAGRQNNILGTNYYWAGGGGGSGWTGAAGKGGFGGGGGGGANTGTGGGAGTNGINTGGTGAYIGGDGAANTGGGGGGGTLSNYSGGKGGSGIVILLYLTVAPTTSTLLSISGSAFKQTTTDLIATTSVGGTVSFYANGRIINHCQSVATVSSSIITATCHWKPLTHGGVALYAVLTPVSGYISSTSQIINSVTAKRTISR
jgi:hypothetical protein